MKLNARHLTVDLYNCKNSQLTDINVIEETLGKSLAQYGANLLNLNCEEVGESHHAIIGILTEGHITLHVYSDLKYVAMDIFLCEEDTQPEAIAKELRSFFKPDKTKTTLLKRGDFTGLKEIRPKVKTHVAPLRKIHNTGAKVIKILAHRGNK